MFFDPAAIMRHDRTVDSEQLWHMIGALDTGSPVLLVAHTISEDGEDSVIRIVSARKATRNERRLYEESEDRS